MRGNLVWTFQKKTFPICKNTVYLNMIITRLP